MEREKIKIADIATNAKYPDDNDLCMDDWDTVWVIERKEKDFDADKGFIDYECVVQRRSDEKFFKFTYTQFGYNGDDARDQTAEEVFPKEKTITVYE